MKPDQANDLLDHDYLPLESGWVRNDDGTAMVAARTQMIGCTGAMIEWWFSFIHHTEQYLWWHPRDHTFSDWIGERGTGKYVGGTHLAGEYIGAKEYQLKINFRHPSMLLDTSRFAAAGVSAAVCARIGERDHPGFNGYLCHLIQDIPEGCVMRSRFFLGYPEPYVALTREQLMHGITVEFIQGLHKHSTEEMAILASFLPGVYRLYHPPQAEGK